LIETWQYRP